MLFTCVVSFGVHKLNDAGSTGYTAQHRADSWEAARGALFNSEPFRTFVQAAMPAVLGSQSGQPDIVLFVPMDPLTNCWVLQGGRAAECFTAIVVATSETELDPEVAGSIPVTHPNLTSS